MARFPLAIAVITLSVVESALIVAFARNVKRAVVGVIELGSSNLTPLGCVKSCPSGTPAIRVR
jgi:hypothetical protein